MPSDENERRLTANYHLSKKRIILNNFIGGISWGVGSVIGATIILAALIWFLNYLHWIPGVGGVADQVNETIRSSPIKK